MIKKGRQGLRAGAAGALVWRARWKPTTGTWLAAAAPVLDNVMRNVRRKVLCYCCIATVLYMYMYVCNAATLRIIMEGLCERMRVSWRREGTHCCDTSLTKGLDHPTLVHLDITLATPICNSPTRYNRFVVREGERGIEGENLCGCAQAQLAEDRARAPRRYLSLPRFHTYVCLNQKGC